MLQTLVKCSLICLYSVQTVLCPAPSPPLAMCKRLSLTLCVCVPLYFYLCEDQFKTFAPDWQIWFEFHSRDPKHLSHQPELKAVTVTSVHASLHLH